MQLIKPSVEFLNMTENPLKAIEIAGRTCFKSEDLITDDSAEKFTQMLVKRGHEAMIEHASAILSVSSSIYEEVLKVEDRQFIRMTCDVRGNGCLISGNFTALRAFCLPPGISSGIQRAFAVALSKDIPIIFDDTIRYTDHLAHLDTDAIGEVELYTNTGNLSSLSNYEKLEHLVMSYRFICDRGVTHEIVRHRLFSYAQESTRYCNYKGGVTFIIPPWLDSIAPGEYQLNMLRKALTLNGNLMPYWNSMGTTGWAEAMQYAELWYKELLEQDWTPQQARSVLPNSLKTEIVVTGNLREWKHFFTLRCARAAHPQMREVANMALADIKQRVPVIFDEIGV